ncbi:MAG: hypothetical protein LKF47_06255 [Megasphaera sp.]|jgi:hypothetical protein|nr:hypothetical protein [Megasphaera sp.]MCI1248492.1 hypothetical protein [Megasphaera sp.]
MSLKLRIKQAFCTIAAVVMVGGAAFAATPSDVYQEAAQHMTENPQGEYTVHMALNLPMVGSANVDNVIDVQKDPFRTKSTTTVDVFGKKSGDPITTYIEQNGDTLNVYYEENKDNKTTWKKTTQKLDSARPITESIHKTNHPMAGVKSVAAAGMNRYTVVYDSQKLYAETDKTKWQDAGYTKEQINTAENVLQALQKAGDITAVVTIDPATKRISRVTMPLTSQLRGMALAVVDTVKTTDANKAVIQQFIKYSDVDMTIDCNELPKGIDIAVPAAVKAQAKEEKSAVTKK